MRSVVGVILAFVLALSFATPVHAADFATFMDIRYQVSPTGVTDVQYQVRLRNLTSTIYAQEFAHELGVTDAQNITVRDEKQQPLPFEKIETDQKSILVVRLPETSKVLGRDKERTFTLNFTSESVAAAYGQVLEVAVPKLADPSKYEQYNVVVSVPESFGEPSLVVPNRYTLDTVDGQYVARFTNVGQATGIALVFGSQQSYGVTLTYHVRNPAQNTGVVEVALPPDTAWQRVWWDDVMPRPDTIRRDQDGNWIAEFTLAGEAEQSITAHGTITLFAQAQPLSDRPGALPARNSWWQGSDNLWLRSTPHWPTENQSIAQLAQQHASPRAIYDYVVDALQYNYRRFENGGGQERLGAARALADPTNAVCQEFTDVYIAIARAADIPARRVIGYGLTQNSRLRPLSLVSDVLHAWPEYYDTQRQLWVPIDPTWGDTTGGVDYFSQLDFRHLTFAIQGQADERPLAAGMYKTESSPAKDVQVEVLSQTAEPIKQPLEVSIDPGWLPEFGLPTKIRLQIHNPNGGAEYTIPVALGVSPELRVTGAFYP